MVTIDGTKISGATIDGTDVQEITIDGDGVWTAIPDSVVEHMDYWWPMDEGTGTTLNETLSGNEFNATLFNGGSWGTGSGFGDSYPTFDGIGDNYLVDDPLALNESEYSLAVWVYISGMNDFTRFIDQTETADNTATGNPNGGWVIQTANDEDPYTVQLAHISGGAADVVGSVSGLDKNKWYFVGVSGNGNNGAIHVWNPNSKENTDTGSGPRETGGSLYLRGMGGAGDRWIDGRQDAASLSTSLELSESNFEDIWNDTKALYA